MFRIIMRSIEALGAAGEVTGSAFALTSNKGKRYLVDCGMFQGKAYDERNKSLNSHDPNQFEAVFITHAHLDHIGRLPHLHKTKAPIFMTPATKHLAGIALKNADILSRNLYPEGSVDKILKKTVPLNYNSPVNFDGVTATFINAGHILGSSSLLIQEQGGDMIAVSGDIGGKSDIILPTTPIKHADIVIMETTYGNRNHPKENPTDKIMEAVERIKKTKGTLFIPAFAIDRTQVILAVFKKLREEGRLDDIPVYLDSPMGIAVTKVYANHRYLLNKRLNEQKNPFVFSNLFNTITNKESIAIRKHRGPKIIIASSGMVTGGRAENHASDYLPDDKSVILFVGYPAEGTPSRAIVSGEKKVLIGNEYIDVNAAIYQTSAFSAHADQRKLLEWLGNIRSIKKDVGHSPKVILIHGDNSSREEFSRQAKQQLRIKNIFLPKENEIINF